MSMPCPSSRHRPQLLPTASASMIDTIIILLQPKRRNTCTRNHQDSRAFKSLFCKIMPEHFFSYLILLSVFMLRRPACSLASLTGQTSHLLPFLICQSRSAALAMWWKTAIWFASLAAASSKPCPPYPSSRQHQQLVTAACTIMIDTVNCRQEEGEEKAGTVNDYKKK